MILSNEILMGRDKEFPLTPELQKNLIKLLHAVNIIRVAYGHPMTVSSGYRPGHYNKDAGGASNSAHLTCEACDFADPDNRIKQWLLHNIPLLEMAELYMESPSRTNGWVHLQTRTTRNRVFLP